MDIVISIILYSFVSGITILIGATGAQVLRIKNIKIKEEINHGTIAFGGGVLIAAVAFALIPRAIEKLSLLWLIIIFLAGTFSFFAIDKSITSKGGSLAQVMAMLMDFIPEAIALGAAFAHDIHFGLLLALFIGLQNLPEGFNSYGELLNRYSVKKSFLILLPLSFLGVIAALFGNYYLSDNPEIVAATMLFAGGGIIYLMFQDIAPLSKMENVRAPALGASFGFLIGMVGEKLLL